MPTAGGEPVRLTYHPMPDRVVGWTPDGRAVLFASSRESGRQRYSQFYTVGLAGGLPEKLSVPYGEFGAYSPDGRTVRLHADGAGLPQLEALPRRLVTGHLAVRSDDEGREEHHRRIRPTTRSRCGTADTIYFVSDRGANERNNIWAYDVKAGTSRQVTQFDDFDITFPSLGPDGIVFQAGGRLYFLDVPSGKQREVPVRVVTDEATLRPRTAKVDIADPVGDRLADRQARAVRGARRRVHRAGGVRAGGQRQPDVRRRRALSALVARRQDARLLERQERRVRADPSARPRAPVRSGRSRRSAPDSATRRTGRPTARRSRSSTRRCGSTSSTSSRARR